jgi:5-methylcytosine-specific restriction endonuclease McrA
VKACKWCGSDMHYQSFCSRRPRKPLAQRKPIKKRGTRTIQYEKWRDEVAIPYLDKTYGHNCRKCGVGGKLDVQHIQKRGSHPELKMVLSNVEYLCRLCHIEET